MQSIRAILHGTGADALDLGQVDALDLLVQRDSWRMTDLADALRIDRSTATRAVARLVDAAFAVRAAAPGDARGVLVRATAKGRRVQERLADRRRQFVRDVLSGFDARERAMLADLLERLVQGVDEYSNQAGRPKV
jgi:DNA-binding MarR family transcriptional regulator